MTLYETYRAAVAGRPMPLGLVDLDAVDANVEVIRRLAGDKPLRVATKSIRSLDLTRHVVERLGPSVRGLMTYAAAETERLHEQGYRDLLLAYPTVQRADVDALARINKAGACARVVVDAVEHLDALDAAARAAGSSIPVVIEVDMALRPMGGIHIGVRRSPLHTPEQVVALAREVKGRTHLSFAGIMGYEAQIAGVPDDDPTGPILAGAKRAMKALSRGDVERTRRTVRRALEEAGLAPPLVNGGGTGSLRSSVADETLTEVTVGSGFLVSHLFDGYRDLTLTPAAYFALQVVRCPAPGIVTCHGGGFVASGEAGPSRLPVPALPPGLKLTSLEGAGEVQTPVRVPARVPDGTMLRIGDPIFFRHAKAGELAEHLNEYLLVRGGRVAGVAKTYRGEGWGLLG